MTQTDATVLSYGDGITVVLQDGKRYIGYTTEKLMATTVEEREAIQKAILTDLIAKGYTNEGTA